MSTVNLGNNCTGKNGTSGKICLLAKNVDLICFVYMYRWEQIFAFLLFLNDFHDEVVVDRLKSMACT